MAQEITFLLISARMRPSIGATGCLWPDECAASPNGLPGGWPSTCDVFLGLVNTPINCFRQPGPSAEGVTATADCWQVQAVELQASEGHGWQEKGSEG
ncbi:hypothetical protein HaLaN_28405, partial [Haematococcus lacustris]